MRKFPNTLARKAERQWREMSIEASELKPVEWQRTVKIAVLAAPSHTSRALCSTTIINSER